MRHHNPSRVAADQENKRPDNRASDNVVRKTSSNVSNGYDARLKQQQALLKKQLSKYDESPPPPLPARKQRTTAPPAAGARYSENAMLIARGEAPRGEGGSRATAATKSSAASSRVSSSAQGGRKYADGARDVKRGVRSAGAGGGTRATVGTTKVPMGEGLYGGSVAAASENPPAVPPRVRPSIYNSNPREERLREERARDERDKEKDVERRRRSTVAKSPKFSKFSWEKKLAGGAGNEAGVRRRVAGL
jgi:hypothetical protein